MIPSFPTYVFINDEGLQRGTVNNVLRSDMEIGPQKTRPIQTTPLFQVSMQISMCYDKLIDWRTWWKNQIGSGAYYFLMNDPFDGVQRRFRFISGEMMWAKDGNLLMATAVVEAYDAL